MKRVSIVAICIFILTATSLAADSLWKPESRGMFCDLRPSRIGDQVTVLIVEQSASSQQASTDYSKSLDHSNGAGVGPFMKLLPELAVSSSQKGGADGKTSYTNKFATTLAATVTRVLPNGNMVIEATRAIDLNGERQGIKVCGTVRPQDITQGNTVLSTKLADVKIEYIGKGPVGNRQKEGIISQLVRFLF